MGLYVIMLWGNAIYYYSQAKRKQIIDILLYVQQKLDIA